MYSIEEAFQWAHRAVWHLILIDERLQAQRTTPIFPELKRFAPFATVVLQSEHSDTASALMAVQNGADFLLYKKSPAFLTELLLYTKGILETRTLRMALERMNERHSRLIDTLPDVMYELDVSGKFVSVSPSIVDLLGFHQNELIGVHYASMLPPDQIEHAKHSFHDRRTGARASHRIPVELVRKRLYGEEQFSCIRAEISAKGLYDSERRFLGTSGLLHAIPPARRLVHPLHRAELGPPETAHLLDLAMRVSALSKSLKPPPLGIQDPSQLELNALQGLRPIQRHASFSVSTDEAVRPGEASTRTSEQFSADRGTINDLIHLVLSTTRPPLVDDHRVELAYAQYLAPFSGHADSVIQLIHMLLSHAQRYMAATGSPHRLRISTAAIGPNGVRIVPGTESISLPAPSDFEICIEETDSADTTGAAPIQASGNLHLAYALIKRLGARLELSAPSGERLSITIWIHAGGVSDRLRSPQFRLCRNLARRSHHVPRRPWSLALKPVRQDSYLPLNHPRPCGIVE